MRRGAFHRTSQGTLPHAAAGAVTGQPRQDDGKGPGVTLTAYPRPSPRGSSEGVDLPDASKAASPGSPETGKVTDIVTIMLAT